MYPFSLDDERAYQAWRDRKLDNYPKHVREVIHSINNPSKITDIDKKTLLRTCKKTNIAIYKLSQDCTNLKENLVALARQFGLLNLDDNLCADQDKFSVLEDLGSERATYIPYTNKALNWHTDGYYNDAEHRIRAFLMHCVCPAKCGGDNSYLDSEIAYILLRDENPNYIKALMGVSVMTIPANNDAGINIRPTQTGPVFFIDKLTQSLYMRYTARRKNIIWENNASVKNALSFLYEILQGNPYLFQYRLQAGEGVICNNILHNRTAYEDSAKDGEKRIFYRARFYNRIQDIKEDQVQDVVNQ